MYDCERVSACKRMYTDMSTYTLSNACVCSYLLSIYLLLVFVSSIILKTMPLFYGPSKVKTEFNIN